MPLRLEFDTVKMKDETLEKFRLKDSLWCPPQIIEEAKGDCEEETREK